MQLTDRFSGFPLTTKAPSEGGRPLKSRAAEADNNNDTTQQRLHQACLNFEGFMLGELLKGMRQGVASGGGLLPTGRAERIFINQQCEALGDVLAQREPLGLARLLYKAAGAAAQHDANAPQLHHSTAGDNHENQRAFTEHYQPPEIDRTGHR